MPAISDADLRKLEAASAAADEHVRLLLERDSDQGRFGPRLRAAGYIGTYVVPPVLSWESINQVVLDPAFDIDFSVTQYPDFDGIIAGEFRSDEFINPINANYEKWSELRTNIAAVRNFLLIEYFEKNSTGMSEKQAEEKLEEISSFVGKGLYNNYRFLGMVPNHNPLEPFVDIDKANAPNGEGARYIYERILQKDRQSNWMRPFDAVIELFGGEGAYKWDLPSIHETPFHPGYEALTVPDITTEEQVMLAIEESRRLRALLTEAIQVRDQQTFIKNAADDLDGLGNQLLFSAASAHHVTGLREPVRRNAVEIAKDILNKLKVQLGSLNVQDGLRLAPQDDIAAIGAVKGVMVVYEKMLAHARHVDASILNHPAVVAATQAFGHIGYLSKLESLRFASMMGDNQQVQFMSSQLSRIPSFFTQAPYSQFGELMERIETGFEVVLDRVQQISGPASLLSNSHFDTVGVSMNTPTAGLQAQVAAAIGVQGNQRANQANQAAEQAAQLNAQQMIKEHARKSGVDVANTTTNASGRAALSQAKKLSSQSKSGAQPINPADLLHPAKKQKSGLTDQQMQLQVRRSNPEQMRRAVQGINPLLLKSIRDAQIRAKTMAGGQQRQQQDGAHHQDAHTELSAGGLKPSTTPSMKSSGRTTSSGKTENKDIAAPTTLAEQEEQRRKRGQSATVPGGRTI